MTRFLVLGAGVFAEEVADLAAAAGGEVIGFVEGRDRSRCGTLLGLPVRWIEDLGEVAPSALAVCAVGSPARAGFVEQARRQGVRFGTLLHPSAAIAPSARVEEGAIVGAGVVLGAGSRVGSHAILNRGCLVGHHVRIGDYATLGPGCNVGGLAGVGRSASLGMGAVVLDRITIGEGAIVAAGSLVNHDVPAGTRVAGSPARAVRAPAGGGKSA